MILQEKNHAEAEEYYDGQAQAFESMRGYLVGLLSNQEPSEIVL